MYSISEYAGLLVKQAREEKQWDQQYLADELDIDIRTLKKIEAGKSDIPFVNHDLCVLTCRNIIILLFDALLKT